MTFVLAWDSAGRPTAAFRPDFYLPEHDLFLELTTLRQDLVTRKNRKVRRLRELHPDVRVKLLYRRDFDRLMARDGRPTSLAPAPAVEREPAQASGRIASARYAAASG
ncbi:MAG TPA: hypothetical protein VKV23_02200 [Acidimicrobiales bacterium]|nr:hypothetical protein [Acidimicrobiales bacterium]